MIESIDELGRVTRTEYDAAGRRTRVILPAVDGSSATLSDEYDASGRRVASVDAEAARTLYRYDAGGRLIETTHPDPGADDGDPANNPRTVLAYDAVGRKVAETDEAGRTTRYAFDALGRLIAVALPNPVTGANPPLGVSGGSVSSADAGVLITRYGYDEVGNRVSQTDAEGRITRFEFDAMGRETARVLPGGERESRSYNAAGELIAHTDFRGRTTRWTYDAVGRISRIDYPNDADVSLSYTATGQRQSAIDGHGATSQAYDPRDRLTRRTDSAGRAIEYGYDAVGNLVSRVTASQTLLYTYDARDRLTAVSATVAGGTVRTTRYGYDAQGRRSSMVAGDGTTTTYRYDRRHRLKELTQRSAAALLLFAASYTTDATGLRTGMQESDASGTSRTVAYTYDATRRLSSETIDHRDPTRDRSTSWSYDRVGNRLRQVTTSGSGAGQQTITVDSSYDANDRLTREEERRGSEPVRVTTTSYDANGNTLRREGPEGLTEYVWDDANRLSEQRTANSRTTYRYDADGLRIGQTHFPVSGTPTRTEYLVDPSTAYANVIERYEASGTATAKLSQVYAFGEGIVAQTTCAPTATSAANDCPTPSERFVLSDGFGSTRLLTDPTGAVTDRIDYDAFGNEIGREGTTNVEHLYRGEQYDPNLGFYYLRARYMDPARGRFASMDPFAGFSSDPVSLHKYLYARNDPANRYDPSGNFDLAQNSIAQASQAILISSTIAIGATATAVLYRDSSSERIAARASTIACAASIAGTAVSGPVCGGTPIPILFASAIRTPDIAEHILRSQASGRPRLLSRTVLPPLIASNRSYAYLSCSLGTNRVAPDSGSSCDEYPYASTYEGGLEASVRRVPLWEQYVQGGELAVFFTYCGIPGDAPVMNEFVVIPVSTATRVFQCGRFR